MILGRALHTLAQPADNVLLHELAVDLYLRVRLDFVLAVALLAARRSPRYEYSCARSVREREAFLGRASITLPASTSRYATI